MKAGVGMGVVGRIRRLLGVVVAAAALGGCSGGGGGGGEAPPSTEPVTVGGTVAAPEGSSVDLLRVDAGGLPQTVIASTPVAHGRYRFDLAALGLKPASDLMLRATASGGVPLRALAASTLVDIGAGTEGFVQWLQQSLAAGSGARLSGLTAVEVAGLQGSAHVLALLAEASGSAGMASAIDGQRQRLARHPRFAGALAAALDPAAALTGPGDLLDLVPLADGQRWVYRSSSQPGLLSTADVRATSGAERFEVIRSGAPTDTYQRRPDALMLESAGAIADDVEIGRLIGAYPSLDFPPVPGRERTLKTATGLALDDADGDGKAETMDFSIVRKEGGAITTTLSLPDGTVARAVEIEDRAAITVRFSTGPTALLSVSALVRFAPGIGPVWESTSASGTVDGQLVFDETEVLELTSWFKPLAVIALPHRQVLFDAARGVAYASVPSGAGAQADRVVTIDLATRAVTTLSPPLGAGADPDLLALSGDGQSLWVSLAGTGAMVRLALPSLAVVEQFLLKGPGAPEPPGRAASLATSPTWPDLVAVGVVSAAATNAGVRLYHGGQWLPKPAYAPPLGGDSCRIGFHPTTSRLFALDDFSKYHNLARFFVDPVNGATLEASVGPPEVVARARRWRGTLGWVGQSLLAPDGAFYSSDTLQRTSAAAGRLAGCTVLAGGRWFICNDLDGADIPVRELLADGSTQVLVSTLRVPGLGFGQGRPVDLGRGRIGLSAGDIEGATTVDRLLVIESGPF